MMQVKPIVQRSENIINRLLDIWEASVMKTHTFLSAADIAAIKPDAKNGLMKITDLYCFIDDQDVKQGFIGVEDQKIEMLFLDANARGQGIGKLLLDFALKELGAKYVDVNEQNAQAVGFYMHMGFTVMSRSDTDEQGRPFPILHLQFIPSQH